MRVTKCVECQQPLPGGQCEFPPADPNCQCNGCLAPVCSGCMGNGFSDGPDLEDEVYQDGWDYHGIGD